MNTTAFPFQLLDQIEKMIIAVDRHDQIVYYNQAANLVLGYVNGFPDGMLFSGLIVSMTSMGDCSCKPQLPGYGKVYITYLRALDQTVVDVPLLKKEIELDGETVQLYQECDLSRCAKLEDRKMTYHHAVLNAIPDLLFVLDRHERIVGYHTPTDEQLLLTPSAFIGKTASQCLPKQVSDVIELALQQAREKGSSFGLTYQLETKESTQWWELSVNINPTDTEAHYIVLARNITGPKKAEYALAENEALFRSLIEQGEEGVVVINESGRIILWNKGMEEISGITRAEASEKMIWDVMFELGSEKRKAVPGALDQLKHRFNRLISKEDMHWFGQPMEAEIVSRAGNTRLVQTTLFPVEYNDKYLIGAIHRDITAQKMSELSLRENEEYMRTLYYDSPVPVLVIDALDFSVFDLNHAAVKAFAYGSREQIIGVSFSTMVAEDQKELFSQSVQPWLNQNLAVFDCHFQRDNDEIWDATVHTFRLSVNGRDLIQLTLIDTTAHNKAMHALFESESRYRAVADSANAGIGIFDTEERIIYANETMAKMVGYEREELIGRSMRDFSTEENFHLFTQKTLQRSSGLVDQYQSVFFDKAGKKLHVSISASPLFSPNQQLIGTVGVVIDISEQVEASRKLFETSEQLKAILASMPDMIFIHDKDGNYLDSYVNQKLYPHADDQPKAGQTLNDIFTGHELEILQSAIQQSLSQQDTVVVNFDYLVENNLRHLEARLSPMGADKVVSVVRDTTMLVTLEKELIYNNKLLRVLTQLATRFINLPVQDIEVEINHALGEIGQFAGVDRVYVFDYDWLDDCMSNTYEWSAENISPEIDNLQKVPNSVVPDWVNAHKMGEMTYVTSVIALNEDDYLRQILEPQGIQSLITIPLMDSEHCMGYVGFDAVKKERSFSDSEISLLRIFAELITNLKIRQHTETLLVQNRQTLERQNNQLLNLNERLRQQNEEIMQKNRELDIERERALASDKLKTAFLNNVSHEVRTPLNGIVGFAQFLADDGLSVEDKLEFVTALNTSVTRLTDTINDIMDVSLLMSGNMNIHTEEAEPENLLDEIFRKHNFEARSKSLKFRIQHTAEPIGKVFTDFSMLRKIMDELVGNAVKYTRTGSVVFGIERIETDLVLFVNDTGKGIANEALSKVFEPFVQEDSSSTRTHEGSGLGLTIVKGLVELLKGSINVESNPGLGTKIRVSLPDLRPENKKEKPKPSMTNIQASPSNLLIAEDEALNVLYIKRMLKNAPFSLFFASNGKEAIDLVEQHPEIGLILMDIKMPVMDGMEATRQIKKIRPDMNIIAVTAYAAADDRNACFEAGCDDYISKPFLADDLFRLIKKYTELNQ